MERYMAEIITAGQRLDKQGLITANSGNISRRLAGGCLITASGVRKGGLTADDVLLLDYQGAVLQAQGGNRIPSSESGLHVALYTDYPQISAIVHAHPPYATALASAGRQLDCQLLEEARLYLGAVPSLGYFPTGSEQLAQAVAQAAEGNTALLLANHGAVSWGASIEEAVYRMEIIEHTARVMMYKQLFEK